MPAITTVTSSATRVARRVGSHLKPSPSMAVALAALVAGGGGLAYAAVTPGEISACSNKTSGALRVAATCTANENPISWNTVGPQGPAGARGPSGVLAVADGHLNGTDPVHDGEVVRTSDLVVTRPAKVIANGALTAIGWWYGDGSGDTRCHMSLWAGQLYVTDLSRVDRVVNVSPHQASALSMVGSAAVAPGTYQVRATCESHGSVALHGELVAFAAAT